MMPVVWLPAAQISRHSCGDLVPGSLVVDTTDYQAKPVCVGVLCRYQAEGKEAHLLIYAMTDWYDGQVKAGEVIDVQPDRSVLAFSLCGDQALTVEVDLSAPTAADREGGQVGLADGGLRLMGMYGRLRPMQRHVMEIDPATWNVVYPDRGTRQVYTRFDTWRLRLRLSATEVVTVYEASAPGEG